MRLRSASILVSFSTSVVPLWDAAKPFGKDTKKEALQFVEDLRGVGGTRIDDALKTALTETSKDGLPHVVLFLTDGRANMGAITADDVQILLDPRTRTWLSLTTLRHHGWTAFRALRRIQSAQLELAMTRWQPVDAESVDEAALDRLRHRILRQRTSAEHPEAAEVPR